MTLLGRRRLTIAITAWKQSLFYIDVKPGMCSLPRHYFAGNNLGFNLRFTPAVYGLRAHVGLSSEWGPAATRAPGEQLC